jgi:hypothetical protein
VQDWRCFSRAKFSNMRVRLAAVLYENQSLKVVELVLDITLSFAYDTRAVALAGRCVQVE